MQKTGSSSKIESQAQMRDSNELVVGKSNFDLQEFQRQVNLALCFAQLYKCDPRNYTGKHFWRLGLTYKAAVDIALSPIRATAVESDKTSSFKASNGLMLGGSSTDPISIGMNREDRLIDFLSDGFPGIDNKSKVTAEDLLKSKEYRENEDGDVSYLRYILSDKSGELNYYFSKVLRDIPYEKIGAETLTVGILESTRDFVNSEEKTWKNLKSQFSKTDGLKIFGFVVATFFTGGLALLTLPFWHFKRFTHDSVNYNEVDSTEERVYDQFEEEEPEKTFSNKFVFREDGGIDIDSEAGWGNVKHEDKSVEQVKKEREDEQKKKDANTTEDLSEIIDKFIEDEKLDDKTWQLIKHDVMKDIEHVTIQNNGHLTYDQDREITNKLRVAYETRVQNKGVDSGSDNLSTSSEEENGIIVNKSEFSEFNRYNDINSGKKEIKKEKKIENEKDDGLFE